MTYEVLFSASLLNFEPIWFEPILVLLPTALYVALLLAAIVPSTRLTLAGMRKAFKMFALCQCLFLFGHFGAFVTELIPYYTNNYETVEGDVENFVPPAAQYNPHESFTVNGVQFEYGWYNISFGYRRTVLNGGVINSETRNVRISYVHRCSTGDNIIVRIEQLRETE